MNIKFVLSSIGKIMLFISLFMLLPIAWSIIKNDDMLLPFLSTFATFAFFGTILIIFFKTSNNKMGAKESFLIVGFAWILISLIGALPYILSNYIPNVFSAFFETVSGFTTTGATIINDIEALPESLLLYRSLTQWVGGLGILVFILAIAPDANGASNLQIVQAETTGQKFNKFVSTIKGSVKILVIIYLVFTILCCAMLLCGGMNLFNAMAVTFSTVATGGFAPLNASIAGYNSLYVELVVMGFMFLSSINFVLFYFLIIGKIKKVLFDEELRLFFIIILFATIFITLNILHSYATFFDALRVASFQVISYISSSGFATANITLWPLFSQMIMLLLIFVGGCAGSTSGGLKVYRLGIATKALFSRSKSLNNSYAYAPIKFNGQIQEGNVITKLLVFFILYIFTIVLFALIIACIDKLDFVTTFSSAISALGNMGPALGQAEAFSNYNCFNSASKTLLSILMLLGRLEFLPIIYIFLPSTWKRH